jgi:hypothetical protein
VAKAAQVACASGGGVVELVVVATVVDVASVLVLEGELVAEELGADVGDVEPSSVDVQAVSSVSPRTRALRSLEGDPRPRATRRVQACCNAIWPPLVGPESSRSG